MARKDLIAYVCEFVGKLRADHESCAAFGAPLVYTPKTADTPKNVFAFHFPTSDAATGSVENISTDAQLPPGTLVSNSPGVLVLPAEGGYTQYSTDTFVYRFDILVRHTYPGSGYQCADGLLHTLHNKCGVFPQNGKIMAVFSQPYNIYNDGKGLSLYKVAFQALAALRIN